MSLAHSANVCAKVNRLFLTDVLIHLGWASNATAHSGYANEQLARPQVSSMCAEDWGVVLIWFVGHTDTLPQTGP